MGMNNKEMENFIVNSYKPEVLNVPPETEKSLLNTYREYTDILYQYLRVNVDYFIHALNNEMRAVMGHLAEYSMSKRIMNKNDLDKAYGHFRRFNLDALKILCDEYDRALSVKLKKQYSYDYREVCVDYLREFADRYFKAKKLYMFAQQKERVGSDSHVHNVIELYHEAAKEYILLKQYYEEQQPVIQKVKRKVIIKRIINGIVSAFGIIVSAVGLVF